MNEEVVTEIETVVEDTGIIEANSALEQANEKLTLLEEKMNELTELSTSVSGIDEFIVENAEIVVNALNVLWWYGVVGVPLLVIVAVFWTVYKQFLYTNL